MVLLVDTYSTALTNASKAEDTSNLEGDDEVLDSQQGVGRRIRK